MASDNVVVIDVVAQVTDQTAMGIGSVTNKMGKFENMIVKTQKAIERMRKMSKMELTLYATDKASKIIQNVFDKGKSIAGKVWNITLKAVDLVTAPVREIFKLLANPVVAFAGMAGITIGISDTINTFKEFEQKMAGVRAVSQATDEEFTLLNRTAKELGATTKFSASEVAEGMQYLGMAGWETNNIISAMPGLLDLAAAGATDLGIAADIVSDVMTAFAMDAKDAGKAADIFAATASSSNTSVEMLGESFKYVGPLAGAMGYDLDEVSIALGLMANQSVKGSMAGTALRATLTRMVDPTKDTATAMEKLGLSLVDNKGKAKPFLSVLTDMRKGFSGLTEAEKTSYAAMLGGQEAMSGILAIVNSSDDDFNKLTKAIKGSEGAAKAMAKIQMDTLQGSFEELSGAVETLKINVGERLKPHLKGFVDWLTSKMPDIEKAFGKALDFVDEKISDVKKSIQSLVNSPDWQQAETMWDKIKLAWDKLIAEPFDSWWNGTGKVWLADKAKGIGEGISKAITLGVLGLLGIELGQATEDGASIGLAFAQGFMDGFDGQKIGEAIKEALKGVFSDAATVLPGGEETSSTGWLSAVLVGIAGSKILQGLSKGVSKGIGAGIDIRKGFGRIKEIFKGKRGSSTEGETLGETVFDAGAKMAGTGTSGAITETMYVKATTVIVTGNITNGGKGNNSFSGGGSTLALPTAVAPLGLPGGSVPRLPGPTPAPFALPGATSTAGEIIDMTVLRNGMTLIGTGGAVTQGLATVGTSLGSGATTLGGAAAVGGSSMAGAVGGILGLGAGLIDIYQGTKKEGKEAKDEYWQGGTKMGMVGGGAAAGAGIGAFFGGVGAVPGALIGAGIGGIGALFGGDAAGKALSDGTDEGGWLSNFLEGTKINASKALTGLKEGGASTAEWISKKFNDASDGFDKNVGSPIKNTAKTAGKWVEDKWNLAKENVSQTWNHFSGWFDETVWTPVKDVGISAINITVGAWDMAKEGISNIWNDFSGWFDETVWSPIQEMATATGEWISSKWSEAKDWVCEKWSDTSMWFDENIWSPVKEGASVVSAWISQKWDEAKTFVSEKWSAFAGWFEETVWSPIKKGMTGAGDWIGTKWEETKTLVSESWSNFSSWFEETVWTPVKDGVTEAGEWASQKWIEAKSAISEVWVGFSGWFSTTVWKPIKAGASTAASTVSESFKSAKTAVTNAWSGLVGWFNTNVYTPISNDINNLADRGSRSTGMTTSQDKSSVTKHAWGGIMTTPHYGLVAEEGAEAIIPLSASKRSRAFELWQETGTRLGVRPYSNGGIIGNAEDPRAMPSQGYSKGNAIVNAPIMIDNITFHVEVGNGATPESVLQIIRENIGELTDELAGRIATALQQVFANMPLEAEAI